MEPTGVLVPSQTRDQTSCSGSRAVCTCACKIFTALPSLFDRWSAAPKVMRSNSVDKFQGQEPTDFGLFPAWRCVPIVCEMGPL